jgi:T-complex protein 1 subunit eta
MQEYQNVVDAEWKILYDKLDKIVASGAKVVLSKLPIGDVATQYFADRDIFCAGRVSADDLKRTMKACGGAVQSSVNSLEGTLGECGKFEEVRVAWHGDRGVDHGPSWETVR